MDNRRVISTQVQEEDVKVEKSLRPLRLEDYIGQAKAKENLRIKLIEIANLVLELGKMEEQYLSECLKKSKNIIRLEGNYKEVVKQIDDLDIPKDAKERIKSEVFKIFLK